MLLRSLTVFTALTLALGCGDSGTSTPGGLNRDEDEAALNTNPYGIAYPSENVGRTARKGSTAGNTIENFRFQGYPDGVVGELKPMKMADFYDPELRSNIRLIHIQASGSWCPVCRQETQAVKPKLDEWREKGVVWILSMAEGAVGGSPSDQGDLDKWIQRYELSHPAWLDSGNAQLGVFYNAAAMPWNATIDATTMEIVDSHVGFSGVEGLESDFNKWLDEIAGRTGK